jgi:hypothetical protein
MSALLLHCPFHPAPAPHMNKNAWRSSSSSKRNAVASGPSGPSLTWLRTMTRSSKGSTKTHRSPPMQTGERSHGDQRRNGKTCHRHDHQLANGSSNVLHSKRRHPYNPHAEESNYNDHETVTSLRQRPHNTRLGRYRNDE